MSKQNALTIDWEDLMTKTERSVGIAAKMSERIVSALAEALEIQRRLSHEMNQMEKICDEMRSRQAPTPQPCLHDSLSPQSHPRAHLFDLIAAYAVGAVFAGFFASW